MSGLLRKLALFLIAGAIVTVAVAWGAIAAIASIHPNPGSPTSRVLFMPQEPGTVWPRSAPAGWPARPEIQQRSRVTQLGFGKDGPWWAAPVNRCWRRESYCNITQTPAVVYRMDRHVVGWPFDAMQSWRMQGPGFDFGLEFSGISLERRRHWLAKALPIEPMWPGFVLNTLVFAAALWMLSSLALAPLRLRRAFRRHRGRCPHCGFDLRGTPDRVCPECGSGKSH